MRGRHAAARLVASLCWRQASGRPADLARCPTGCRPLTGAIAQHSAHYVMRARAAAPLGAEACDIQMPANRSAEWFGRLVATTRCSLCTDASLYLDKLSFEFCISNCANLVDICTFPLAARRLPISRRPRQSLPKQSGRPSNKRRRHDTMGPLGRALALGPARRTYRVEGMQMAAGLVLAESADQVVVARFVPTNARAPHGPPAPRIHGLVSRNRV